MRKTLGGWQYVDRHSRLHHARKTGDHRTPQKLNSKSKRKCHRQIFKTCPQAKLSGSAFFLSQIGFLIVLLLTHLQLTTVNDGRLDVGADGTGAAAKGLNLPDNLHGIVVSDLTEDNVLAIEPRGHNGGDEELGAVATWRSVRVQNQWMWGLKMTYVLGPALAMERRPGRLCL
jgi:hypothetical protein